MNPITTASYTGATSAAITVLLALDNKYHWGFTADDMSAFVVLLATGVHFLGQWIQDWRAGTGESPEVAPSPAPEVVAPPAPAPAG